MALEFIDRYMLMTHISFFVSYLFILWLIRKQYPLQYCALNPISRYILFFYFWFNVSIVINGYFFETITVDSSRVILITYLVLNAILVCLIILKHKQILRVPRFEFRKLTEQDLASMQDTVQQYMQEKSSAITKHNEFQIGYKNFYYSYEVNKTPILYIEYNLANKLAEVNMEFYPLKEFDLISVHQLMKSLYQSYGKNILAPYLRYRSKYLIIANICFAVVAIAGLIISLNSTWIYSRTIYCYVMTNSLFAIPLFFLFLDVLRKPDKANFLDNQF